MASISQLSAEKTQLPCVFNSKFSLLLLLTKVKNKIYQNFTFGTIIALETESGSILTTFLS